MTILVLTDEEMKALKFILKDHYKRAPDTQTRNVLKKLEKQKYEYTRGKEL